jgi:hypothetical protein
MQRLKERPQTDANACMFSMPAIELEINFLCLDRLVSFLLNALFRSQILLPLCE